jgi:hypothetical protein
LRLQQLNSADMHSTSEQAGTPRHNSGCSHPPYTQEQQDHQLQAMTFAYGMLAKALHAQGVLDLSDLARELDNGEWLFARQPGVRRVVADLADDLRYMRAKAGEPGCGHG